MFLHLVLVHQYVTIIYACKNRTIHPKLSKRIHKKIGINQKSVGSNSITKNKIVHILMLYNDISSTGSKKLFLTILKNEYKL